MGGKKKKAAAAAKKKKSITNKPTIQPSSSQQQGRDDLTVSHSLIDNDSERGSESGSDLNSPKVRGLSEQNMNVKGGSDKKEVKGSSSSSSSSSSDDEEVVEVVKDVRETEEIKEGMRVMEEKENLVDVVAMENVMDEEKGERERERERGDMGMRGEELVVIVDDNKEVVVELNDEVIGKDMEELKRKANGEGDEEEEEKEVVEVLKEVTRIVESIRMPVEEGRGDLGGSELEPLLVEESKGSGEEVLLPPSDIGGISYGGEHSKEINVSPSPSPQIQKEQVAPARAPLAVHTTSWKSCCGLFDAFSRDGS